MQKTAYEMRISDWSSDVCSSDLLAVFIGIFPGFVGGLDFGLEFLETRLLFRREVGRVALERAQIPGVIVGDMGRGNDADFGQPLTCAQGFGGGRELVGHETVEEIPIDPALGRRVGEKVEIDPDRKSTRLNSSH